MTAESYEGAFNDTTVRVGRKVCDEALYNYKIARIRLNAGAFMKYLFITIPRNTGTMKDARIFKPVIINKSAIARALLVKPTDY